MGCVKEKPGDDQAAYFRGMARRYERLAHVEPHESQSELFAALAADYSELAADAAAATRPAPSAAVEGETGALARVIERLAGRPPAVPLPPSLTLPAAPSGAK